MVELKRILLTHAARYPGMRPGDAVKLIYQNEFGGGHLIRDEAAAMEYLRREYEETEKDPDAPLYEEIGNGVVRVNLAAVKAEELDALGREFIRSTQRHKGNMEAFLRKLAVLRDLTGKGAFSFDPEQLEEYLEAYVRKGCPAVSHSPEYRTAYRPAYRVVCREDRLLDAVCKAIDSCNGTRKIIAIDGRCASGKSTLAEKLQARYGCNLIPMDHFFLRPHQRTEQRFAVPGENIDHERFLQEVLLPLKSGKAFAYRPFDCGVFALGEPIQVPESPLTIVEGSYSCHKDLWEHYDLRIFLTVEQARQMERILRRNGEKLAQMFEERWIPMEEAYFSAFDVERRADLRFDTSE